MMLSCFSRMLQSETRKKLTKRYCKKHKLHYFTECPLCSEEQQQLAEV